MHDGKLGVCIVGCGHMGTIHAEHWDSLPEARVVAVVDILENRARELADLYDLDAWYLDHQPAVSIEEVDVVSVCVPTCYHPEITIFAAEQGKHVLCEKPIALTLREAEAMIRASEQGGVKLGLGFMRRHSPITPELQKWLSAGHLGRPVMYHATDVREIRPKREMHAAYANGGPVIDMGVHLFDVWATIFDSEPVEVFTQGLKLGQHREELAHIHEVAHDTATIVVHYASGDIGSFVVTWGLPPHVNPPPIRDRIFGPKGMAEVEYGVAHQRVRVMREGGRWEAVAAADEDMYKREVVRFSRSVLKDELPLTTGEDGRAALSIALAAIESIQTGQAVHFR